MLQPSCSACTARGGKRAKRARGAPIFEKLTIHFTRPALRPTQTRASRALGTRRVVVHPAYRPRQIHSTRSRERREGPRTLVHYLSYGSPRLPTKPPCISQAHSVREVVKLVLLEVPLGRLRLGISPAKGGAHHGEGVSRSARADEQPERRANEQQRARLEGQRRGGGGREGSGRRRL